MERAVANLLEACPRRAEDCAIERQTGAADAPTYILKDAAGSHYMMLSEEGLFLWQHMDGARTIRDLCGSYVARFERGTPQEALLAIGRFCENGLIRLGDAPDHADKARTGWRAATRALCIRYWWLPEIDRPVTALYRMLRPLYGSATQAMLLGATLAGLVAFALHLATGGWPATDSHSGALTLWAASLAIHVLVHEAAHALTCKHFGRQVRRAGIGWYYLAPVAFVDTSDIWAASRLQRVLVSAAGPYSNLVLSGISALGAALLSPESDVLWTFSAVGYALAFINLNPLLELDGYYIVMDLLELPNLRARALACLGGVLRGNAREERRRTLLVAFGAASLAYGLALAVAILFGTHLSIERLAGAALPQPLTEAASWLMAGVMCLLVLRRLLDGLQMERPR